MPEPTRDEINEYLSEKFDGWNPPDTCQVCSAETLAYHADGSYLHPKPTPYCGPSADPILAIVTKHQIRLVANNSSSRHDWGALAMLNGSGMAAMCPTFPEAAARAVYAMLKAKETADD